MGEHFEEFDVDRRCGGSRGREGEHGDADGDGDGEGFRTGGRVDGDGNGNGIGDGGGRGDGDGYRQGEGDGEGEGEGEVGFHDSNGKLRHRKRVCSSCCVEIGSEGEVWCLGCVEILRVD